jgi:hypothetical protein
MAYGIGRPAREVVRTLQSTGIKEEMVMRHSARWMIFATIVAGLIPAAGATEAGGRVGGSSLSEAAEEADKEPGEKKKVLASGVPACDGGGGGFWASLVAVFVSSPGGEESEYVEEGYLEEETWIDPETLPPPEPTRFYLGLGVRGGLDAGLATQRTRGVTVRGGIVPPGLQGKLRTELELGWSETQFSDFHAAGLYRGQLFSAAVTVRYFLLPTSALAAPYVLAGVEGGFRTWSYTGPVFVEDEWGIVQTVTSDVLPTWMPFVGMGINVVQTPGLELGFTGTVGPRFHAVHTWRGFYNDLFDPSLVGELRAELTFLFR